MTANVNQQWLELSSQANTPDTGKQFIYPKTDGFWYTKDDGGTETQLVSTSSSAAFTSNITITKADPSIIFNTVTATDTDFWMGVQEDAGGDNDDLFQIGTGTSPGTSALWTLDKDGNVGIGGTPSFKLDVTGTGRFTSDLTLSGAPGKIKPASDGTNALQITNAAGTTAMMRFDTSNIAIGMFGVAPQAASGILINHDITITSGSYNGVNSAPSSNPSGSSSAAISGFQAIGSIKSGNAQTHTGSLRGINAAILHNGTGTLTAGFGIRTQNQNLSTATITSLYGQLVTTPVNSGGGAVTGAAAFVAEAQTVGGNNTYVLLGTNTIPSGNWGIYSTSANDSSLLGGLALGKNSAPNTRLDVLNNNATTNAVDNILTIGHDSTGTAAAGFGGGMLMQLESSTTAAQNAALVEWLWNSATHASYIADLVLSAYNAGTKREAIRIRGNTEAQLGFYGVTPISRAVLATGAGATVDNVITALQNLGLVKQS